ncbi:MAG: hypothetical protein GY803_03935 [Chloroflexi bacterium]|nr:hypothetical protein [Chloroflexota bacterium]
MSEDTINQAKVFVYKDAAYIVYGDIKIVRKKQISSEHGEPMTWQTMETVETENRPIVGLCRCGASSDKPFCDGTHKEINFDGAITAENNTFEERKIVHEGGTGIVVKRDYSLCSEVGFCGHRLANIEKLTKQTDDSIVRAQVMSMIERCPSGSYTYALNADSADIEPDLPQQIAVTTEMTSEGPIAGPLWLTGDILVEHGDGETFEKRNRVTLCRCGKSENKPFCDGTHRAIHAQE